MNKPWFKRINLLAAKETAAPAQVFTFSNLAPANRVIITTNLNRPIKSISDPEIIRRIISFIQGQSAGWTVPKEGVPVLPVRLNFYEGDRILGNFGVGKQTFTAHQLGGFYARYPTQADRDRLVELIGVKDNFFD